MKISDTIIVFLIFVFASTNTISISGQEELPAFPGAEGDGKYVTGGRGGRIIREVTTHAAEMAYNKVLYHAGASLVRDSVDMRIIHDVTTGTATFMGCGNGSTNGIIDTQNAVGGWPELKSTEAPADSDSDGMPDDWEIANGLNENNRELQVQLPPGTPGIYIVRILDEEKRVYAEKLIR